MVAKSRLLLLSNSTMSGTDYMQWSQPLISQFLTNKVKRILFIPFAGVSIDWDEYESKVRSALNEYTIESIHKSNDYLKSVAESEAIVVGGGNSFHLLYKLQEFNLIQAIRHRVLNEGIPYVGWSAGANVSAPDISTTNDMPIIWPVSAGALNLIPYNINPHYNEWRPDGHNGETRTDRLNECILVRKRPIVAISEGLAIKVEDDKHTIVAPELNSCERCARIWLYNENRNDKPIEVIDVGFGQDIAPIVHK